jgi:hypothetical protein
LSKLLANSIEGIEITTYQDHYLLIIFGSIQLAPCTLVQQVERHPRQPLLSNPFGVITKYEIGIISSSSYACKLPSLQEPSLKASWFKASNE